ncbi:tRNA sulfurtransferase [secondary endosymbiont of Trabutina mannipara]|uniref:tRNA sulfurtransferase n=1 Tax=secondary endosymbiont of Trabutina mannipara TaxID=1835721 RepID=A0A1C3L3V7_9ENTR|nr:tRNA uracil 4-sulfurtransferase ThiI [secondary endosymbiont of Trabutina mannipara]SBT81956.1 tRNA sulfurtransferase [secondary endosymbiont of Trabutina mannipara]
MKFIIKIFPEIMIKSKSVRLLFIKILTGNIRNILKNYYESVAVVRYWDRIKVCIKDEKRSTQFTSVLTSIPGIHHVEIVEESTWKDMHDIYLQTLIRYRNLLIGKSFCVRVKRRGTQYFTSQDVERYIGSGLSKNINNTEVNLKKPDKKILLEIDNNRLIFIYERFEGIGGFPIGTQENVLSLISGGFDSAVSSYMMMRRGCRVNYCFFNIGGNTHEIGVRQAAYHLWYRFGFSHEVRFISIDFAPILNEILMKVNCTQMGIVLKRMMVRTASTIAERYGIQALVMGESLGQVSSQTLTNMRLIDNVSNILILRPLISHDKEHIIKIARHIGTEEYAKKMPEYCGVFSKNPTVRAVKKYIEQEEDKFNLEILNTALTKAQVLNIRDILDNKNTVPNFKEIETIAELGKEDIVLDIRLLDEQEVSPLTLNNIEVHKIPFYKLHSQFCKLDQSKSYLLYCSSGFMSRLQAIYLYEQGFHNVKIYCPINKKNKKKLL